MATQQLLLLLMLCRAAPARSSLLQAARQREQWPLAAGCCALSWVPAGRPWPQHGRSTCKDDVIGLCVGSRGGGVLGVGAREGGRMANRAGAGAVHC